MNVLIAGINGFLGTALAKACLKDGHHVWGLRHSTPTSLAGLEGSLTMAELLGIDIKFEYVFIAVGSYQLSESQLRAVNEELPQILSDLFFHAKIIFISSTAVYGSLKNRLTEKIAPHPLTSYGKSKLQGELLVAHHSRHAIVRLTYLFGKSIPNNSFLPTIIKAAQRDKRIILTDQGERKQDYLHIEDAAELALRAAHYQENDTFLGATGTSTSNKEIAEKICSLVPSCQIEYQGSSEAMSQFFDPSYTEKILLWKPKYDIVTYLPEMLNL